VSLSDVLDEVQRRTGWRRDDVIYAAALAMFCLPAVTSDAVRHAALRHVMLAAAGVEPQPWATA
jgi:hypothetical protein